MQAPFCPWHALLPRPCGPRDWANAGALGLLPKDVLQLVAVLAGPDIRVSRYLNEVSRSASVMFSRKAERELALRLRETPLDADGVLVEVRQWNQWMGAQPQSLSREQTRRLRDGMERVFEWVVANPGLTIAATVAHTALLVAWNRRSGGMWRLFARAVEARQELVLLSASSFVQEMLHSTRPLRNSATSLLVEAMHAFIACSYLNSVVAENMFSSQRDHETKMASTYVRYLSEELPLMTDARHRCAALMALHRLCQLGARLQTPVLSVGLMDRDDRVVSAALCLAEDNDVAGALIGVPVLGIISRTVRDAPRRSVLLTRALSVFGKRCQSLFDGDEYANRHVCDLLRRCLEHAQGSVAFEAIRTIARLKCRVLGEAAVAAAGRFESFVHVRALRELGNAFPELVRPLLSDVAELVETLGPESNWEGVELLRALATPDTSSYAREAKVDAYFG